MLLRNPIHPVAMAAVVLAGSITSGAIAQLRVVNYNVAQLNGTLSALQNVFAALNDDDKPGFATAPHVYVFQEVRTTNTGPLVARLNNAAPPGVVYVLGTYTNDGEDGNGGAQAICFREDMITELTGGHIDIWTGAGRYADRWRIRLNGYTVSGSFYIYSAHLRAGTGSSNAAERLSGVQAIRQTSDVLPAGTPIIYAGDFNFYTNTEAGYQAWFAAGNGQALDPLGTGSWAGAGNAIKHTQSPLLVQSGALIGGGMDDRFDFQLSTSAFHNGSGWSIIPGTYRSFGNDGNHYDQAINNGNNTYYPDDIPRSNALANNLILASDHVPVVVEYQMPARMGAVLPIDLGRIILGAETDALVEISNTAPAIVSYGAEALTYNAVASGGLSGVCDGSVGPLDPPAACGFAVDASSIGVGFGQVTVTSPNVGNPNPSIPLNTQWRIVNHSQASLDSAALVTAGSWCAMAAPDSGLAGLPVAIHNLNYDADQALLDVTAAAPTSPFVVNGALPTAIGASAVDLPFAFDTSGAGVGDYTTLVTVSTSDEAIPGGAGGADLEVTLRAYVRSLPGDATGDCGVGLGDLLQILTTFGACSGDAGYYPPADFDASGCIDLPDLLLVLVQFGTSCP